MKKSIQNLSLVACLLVPSWASAQSAAERQSPLAAEHFQRVRELYAKPQWKTGVARTGFPWLSFAPEDWRASEARVDGAYLMRSYRRADPAGQPNSFWAEILVADSPEQAQEALLAWLASVTRAEALPSTTSWQLDLGDVGFVGPSGVAEGALAWLAFVRGNVAIRLVANDPRREPQLALGRIALEFDRALLAQPTLGQGVLPARPEIRRFTSAATSLKAGEQCLLQLESADIVRGEQHIEWIVAGTAQGYVETDALGRYVLHTTGAGQLELSVRVTNDRGTTSQRTLELEILDD